MHDLWLDTETFCDTPVKHGTYRYAERVEILLLSWAIDDAEPQVVDIANGEHLPRELQEVMSSSAFLVWFQNGDKFDWPVLEAKWPNLAKTIPQERRRDTMVQAYCHSLPGGLEMMADALGVHEDKRKLKIGRDLIRLFCMPPPKNVKRARATKATHPVEWEQLKEYAKQDIVTMRECKRRMPNWNYKGKQLDMWFLDQKINRRGMCMDVELAEAAVHASEISKQQLAIRTQDMTDGEVGSATQRDEMLKHILGTFGVDLPDMQKATIERRIADESLPEELRELMRVRLQSTTTSVAKFTALLNGVNSDGRLRGCMQYRGAGRTGRVGHRLFQPGNMPRPSMKAEEIEWAIKLLKLRAAHLVYPNVMKVCSNAIRGTIIAPPGKKLVVADLANIEGRMAAWLAGEEWKLQAFRDYDAGIGPDLYILAYAKSFNVRPEDVPPKGDERQIGKVEELMFQYGGGVGAWITGAATYGIDLDQMTGQVWDTLPEWAKDEAAGFLEWLYESANDTFNKAIEALEEEQAKTPMIDEVYVAKGDALRDKREARKLKARHMLPERTFIACDAIKRLWRRAHPEISSYWKELENMIQAAIENPGQRFTARRLVIQRDGAWLRIRLPSGRALCYPAPAWDLVVPAADGKPAKKYPGFSYMGLDNYTKQWKRISSYGGKVFENCIAEGTEVLTEFGWWPIERIAGGIAVWDGVEWVRQDGCVYRGKQRILSIFNVEMTPDHRVLTTKGWRSASSCEGHHRAPCRLPDGFTLSRQQRSTVLVGSEMSLRQDFPPRGFRFAEAAKEGQPGFVRMLEECDDQSAQHQARHVGAPRVLGLEVNAGALPKLEAPCLPSVRRPGNPGLHALAKVVRSFLDRYVRGVSAETDAGAQQQRERLLESELHLDDVQAAGVKHLRQSESSNSSRYDDSSASGGLLRDQAYYASLPVGSRVAFEQGFVDRRRPTQPVWDLMSCGPRQRFVVRGSDGIPLIVHNCTQAAACDQLLECGIPVEEAGFEIVLSVHDEYVTEAPADRDDLSAARLGELMCADLDWNKGLPLAAAGYEALRYKKE